MPRTVPVGHNANKNRTGINNILHVIPYIIYFTILHSVNDDNAFILIFAYAYLRFNLFS